MCVAHLHTRARAHTHTHTSKQNYCQILKTIRTHTYARTHARTDQSLAHTHAWNQDGQKLETVGHAHTKRITLLPNGHQHTRNTFLKDSKERLGLTPDSQHCIITMGKENAEVEDHKFLFESESTLECFPLTSSVLSLEQWFPRHNNFNFSAQSRHFSRVCSHHDVEKCIVCLQHRATVHRQCGHTVHGSGRRG